MITSSKGGDLEGRRTGASMFAPSIVRTVEPGIVYEAKAYRDGKWWTFELPELNNPAPNGATIVAMGQVRSLSDLDDAARGVAALWLALGEDEVAVNVTITLPADVAKLWAASAQREEDGRAALSDAAKLRREAVQTFRGHGVTQRDVARVLGISAQRVNQLTNQ